MQVIAALPLQAQPIQRSVPRLEDKWQTLRFLYYTTTILNTLFMLDTTSGHLTIANTDKSEIVLTNLRIIAYNSGFTKKPW